MVRTPTAVTALSALFAGTLTAVLTAAPAAAAPTTVLMDGMAGDNVFLNAVFTANRFSLDPAGRLIVDGTLTGTITGPPGTLQKAVDQPVVLPIDRGASAASCWTIDLAVGPADQRLAGFPFHLDRSNLHVGVNQGPGSRLRMPMCAFSRALPDDGAGPAQLTDPLNEVVALRASVPATR